VSDRLKHAMKKEVVEMGGMRLDLFLAEVSSELSRSFAKQLILKKIVLVNGLASKPNYHLKRGDVVTWSIPPAPPCEPQPESIALDILHEEDSFLVLNKSPGMVVHPAPGHETGTLVNALLFHDPCFKAVERAGIVHRLDKDTSGALVVAKTPAARIELQRQFKARETQKEYWALVWGKPPKNGRIENRMGRHPANRKKMAVLKEGGRIAISTFEMIEDFEKMSLLKVCIETGRTHQIRVHLTHLGFPIVGDSVYGRARKFNGILPQRQMLHAHKIGFAHPSTKKELLFNAPLSYDMDRFLNALREGESRGNNIL